MYYRVCPLCGASLDPGETCTCQDERTRREEEKRQREQDSRKRINEEEGGQLRLAV